MINEVKFSEYAKTNKLVEEINLDEFIKRTIIWKFKAENFRFYNSSINFKFTLIIDQHLGSTHMRSTTRLVCLREPIT